MAFASTVVSADSRATGLALVATVVSSARLVSSFGFGLMWGRIGPYATVGTFLFGLTAVLPLAARLLGRRTATGDL
jgi:hypothetical protein